MKYRLILLISIWVFPIISLGQEITPIDANLELYRRTRKREFLEKVYFLDQQSKASMLGLGNSRQVPTISQVQKKLDPYSSILTYYFSEKELLIIVISHNRIAYYQSFLPPGLREEIFKLKKALYDPEETRNKSRYSGPPSAYYLYQQLIEPVLSELTQVKRLIIIPNEELLFLPFEAFQDHNRNYLVQRFSILYQFSTAMPGHAWLGSDSSRLLILAAKDSLQMPDLTTILFHTDTTDIITGSWKAANKPAAYTLERLHFYLGRSYRRDEALQLAKIDMLKNPEIGPLLKTPDHWSQLMLIGTYVPQERRKRWAWVSVGIIAILLTYYFFKRKTPAT